eukprot:1194962-Prorocentrum_minimum.AAC.5
MLTYVPVYLRCVHSALEALVQSRSIQHINVSSFAYQCIILNLYLFLWDAHPLENVNIPQAKVGGRRIRRWTAHDRPHTNLRYVK